MNVPNRPSLIGKPNHHTNTTAHDRVKTFLADTIEDPSRKLLTHIERQLKC